MKPIHDLISHYKKRKQECIEEISRIQNLEPTENVGSDMYEIWVRNWEEERRICRDTISYLATLEALYVRGESKSFICANKLGG